jgi:hypothetical protein
VLLGQALLDALDRGDLRRAERRFVERRQVLDLGSPRGLVGVGLGVADLLGQSRGVGKLKIRRARG